MKRKSILILVMTLIVNQFVATNSAFGQYEFAVSDFSISATNVKYGLPFKPVASFHPGIEAGITFLKKDKERSSHSVGASMGYYFHDLIANACYLSTAYDYQLKIKNAIGIDLGAGIGVLYSIYPGEGYRFNDSSVEYETIADGKVFAIINAGFGLSYIKPKRIHPFIHYDFNYFNIWELNPYLRSTAMLKAGVKINL